MAESWTGDTWCAGMHERGWGRRGSYRGRTPVLSGDQTRMIVRDLRGPHKPSAHWMCALWAYPRATYVATATVDADIDRLHVRHPIDEIIARVTTTATAPSPATTEDDHE